jgi:nucleotide-binding universal stress UspA family protein
VDESGKQLREKAGEVSGIFANELNNTSRSFELQTRQQLEDTVQDAFRRIQMLFAEAADTTSAAFTDEIQRNARRELEGFSELTNRSFEESRERLDAERAEFGHKLTTQQEEFLRRFKTAMNDAVGSGVVEARGKVEAGFAALWESWKKMSDANMSEMHNALGKLSNEGAEQYRARLENISNSWMVAAVTTLDHQSRDVIAKIAATAEERLREATSEVFARFGDTLRERLQQIAVGFDKPAPPKS